MKPEERWERGTDRAYNEALEQREVELLHREMLEDRILKDRETFQRLAELYAWESMNNPYLFGFLDWGVERLILEETPAFENAWENDRIPNMASWERAQRGE